MRLLGQVQCSCLKNNDIFPQIDLFFRHFFHNLVCLFLQVVPVPARASAHARHVLAFVVSRFSAGNYLDNN